MADQQLAADFIDPPTTKVVAIGDFATEPDPAVRQSILPSEISETLRVYLKGKIDQLYVRKDRLGVVFIMNVDTIEEAASLLKELPLGRAGLMTFEFIPIGPLWPMNFLLLPPVIESGR